MVLFSETYFYNKYVLFHCLEFKKEDTLLRQRFSNCGARPRVGAGGPLAWGGGGVS
jgi:hypothetical protein